MEWYVLLVSCRRSLKLDRSNCWSVCLLALAEAQALADAKKGAKKTAMS